MVFETKNISLNSRKSAETYEIKISRKNSKSLPKTGKIAEVFLTFHLMRQLELKERANKPIDS